MKPMQLPLYADGINLSSKELIACQSLATALPQKQIKASANLAGGRTSTIKGRGMEFAEVRRYQAGDDVRTIDWRVTARTGKTYTKLFVEERERPVLILLDLSHSLYFGSNLLLQSVQAAHLAATLGWLAINQGDRLGALVATENEHIELKPRSRQQGILSLFNSITKLHQHQLNTLNEITTRSEHLVEACRRLRRLAKPGSLVWIITDGIHFTQACQPLLTELKRHCEIASFLITDPLREGSLPLPKQFQLPVRESGVELILDRDGYNRWLNSQQQQQSEFANMMQQLTIPVRKLDAAIRLQDQLERLRV